MATPKASEAGRATSMADRPPQKSFTRAGRASAIGAIMRLPGRQGKMHLNYANARLTPIATAVKTAPRNPVISAPKKSMAEPPPMRALSGFFGS